MQRYLLRPDGTRPDRLVVVALSDDLTSWTEPLAKIWPIVISSRLEWTGFLVGTPEPRAVSGESLTAILADIERGQS